jgi:TonB-linked SusC/RagA family outer membrane protein
MKKKLHLSKALKLCFILSLLFVLCCQAVFAQSNITGTVSDKSGPLIGVGVQVKGGSASTVTDGKGAYTISAASTSGTILVFTYIGYNTQEIQVNNRSVVNVTMVESASDLSEVVVVGYGTQRKKDLTGAISVVKPADLQKKQGTTVAESLQGLATGIRVRGGGQPGSEAQIQIRGLKNMGTIGGTNPLYVVDGLITTANRDFNPADIESIQILKDASAAAIYGSRAGNGVIIITTKKGSEGPMKIEFTGKTGVQTIPRYDLTETEEFSRINFMAYDNAGLTRQKLDLNNNTDWQDVAFRTGNIQDYNMSFTGGSKDASYYVSGGYFGNKGTVISTDFDRISFRVNTKGTRGIFTIGENLAISNAKADEMSGNPIVDIFRMLPTIPVYDASHPGGYGYGDEAKARTFGTNPLAIANLEDRTNENLRIRGNLYAELQLLKSLRYRGSIGYETSRDHYRYLKKDGFWTLNQAYDPAILNENRGESSTILAENTLTFNEKFGKHGITLIGGQSYQKDKFGIMRGTKRNILQNLTTGHYYDVLNQGNEPQTSGERTRVDLISYFGRLEYNYADKYLLNAIVRYDGSSRLSKDEKFDSFPSVSAAWRVSEEDFFESSWINDLKIRGSYGTLGTGNIGPYDYISFINTFPTVVFGPNQTVQPGGIQVQLANNDLRWEKLQQQNYGLDAAFLNSKLSVTAEYFIAKTEDVLLQYPIPLSTGNDGGNPYVNGATLINKGFEFTATYAENAADFKYNITANLTTLNNKVQDLGYGKNKTFVGNTVTEAGNPIGMWYVLQTNGLFQNLDEVNSYKNSKGQVIQPGAKPGDIRFRDNNDDGQISNDDKVVVGSPWADYELGLNFGASYKGFEFNMDWFGSFGAKVFNGPRSVTDNFSDNSNYRKGVQPWTPENPNTDIPRAFYGSTINARGDTDRWLENGSFARMKYIGISYNIPSSALKKIGFSTARLTLSGQNLITITKYTGLDPEFNNASIFEKGFDFGAFPNLRTVSLGLNFGF